MFSLPISSRQLAQEIGAKSEGPETEIIGITSPNFPKKNQIITLLDTGIKNRPIIEKALAAGNCFFTAEEFYRQIPAKNSHAWILAPAAKLRHVFIDILTGFDSQHLLKPSISFSAVSGKLTEHCRQDLTLINTEIADDVFIGPQVTVGSDTKIGPGSILLGQNYVGYGVVIGEKTVIHPQVTVHNGTQIGDGVIIHSGTVLGSDGFGYEPTPQGMQKIPQIGNVVIGNSVEIGSNCSVDRATLNSTQIGDRVKIDNLVQIGHNVIIGSDSIIVSQVGIAGSSTIGRRVILGGQVGIADHTIIEDGVKIASKSGIPSGKHIPAGSTLRGIPAIEHIQQSRIEAAMRNLIKKKDK